MTDNANTRLALRAPDELIKKIKLFQKKNHISTISEAMRVLIWRGLGK